jgi:hypothetical protein
MHGGGNYGCIDPSSLVASGSPTRCQRRAGGVTGNHSSARVLMTWAA